MTRHFTHHIENNINLVKFVNAEVMMLATVGFATATKHFKQDTIQIFTRSHRDENQIIKKTVRNLIPNTLPCGTTYSN